MHLTRQFGTLLVQTHTKLDADRNLVILANQWRGRSVISAKPLRNAEAKGPAEYSIRQDFKSWAKASIAAR